MGSSPLTRGKLVNHSATTAAAGLIPAHAGKTPGSHSTGLSAWAHPRSRGENSHVHSNSNVLPGSSPLTRGKPRVRHGARRRGGLIPAHAGKTRDSVCGFLDLRAHPRSRGENRWSWRGIGVRRGSSPLTRGKRGSTLAARDRDGLIPAHAGKTHSTASSWTRPPAHPRSRGENLTGAEDQLVSLGSSPLTRGKRVPRAPRHDGNGLIPAHAGKTM